MFLCSLEEQEREQGYRSGLKLTGQSDWSQRVTVRC